MFQRKTILIKRHLTIKIQLYLLIKAKIKMWSAARHSSESNIFQHLLLLHPTTFKITIPDYAAVLASNKSLSSALINKYEISLSDVIEKLIKHNSAYFYPLFILNWVWDFSLLLVYLYYLLLYTIYVVHRLIYQ